MIERILSTSNVEDAVSVYHLTLQEALDLHAPIKEKFITLRETVPWFTKDLMKMKSQLRNLEKTAKELRSNIFWDEYKHVRDCYVKCIKRAKCDFINGKILEAGKDGKKLFAFFDNFIGKSKTCGMPPGNDQDVTDQFADYFYDKIEKIRNGFNISDRFKPSFVNCASFDFDYRISQEDLRKIIQQAKPTTCDNDPLPSALVKNNIEILLPAISHIVNLSLSSGTFPQQLKTAIITPLLKKDGLDPVYSNYRPVSNLTFLSKIIVKAAASSFYCHMESEHLLPKYQSAYRSGFSTETLLLKLHNDILENMEKQYITS